MRALIERLKTALELIRNYEEGSRITVELTQSEIKSMLTVYGSDRSKPEIQERLTALEAQGWKWWVQWDEDWAYRIERIIDPCRGIVEGTFCSHFDTKSEAEEACVEYLLNLNTEEK